MTQYQGNDVFPDSFQVPDDSASPRAVEHNVAHTANGDRTRWAFNRLRALPAYSHFDLLAGTSNIDVVKFNPATRDWYGLSTTTADKFQRTKDYTTWPGTTEITGGGLVMTPVIPGDFEFNSSGHGIIMGNTIDIYAEYNGSVWTRQSGVLGVDPFGAPRGVTVKYSPTSGRWAIAFKTGVANPRVYYGTDRLTWTGVDLPFPTDTEVKIGSNGANTLVAMGREASNLHLSRSADGGATWSAVVTFATGLATYTGVPQVEPVWDGSKWVIVAMSAAACKVYTSSDGLTWSLQASLTSDFIQSLAAIDGVLVGGLGNQGDLIVSHDHGATFRYVDRRFPSASVSSIFWTGTRLVIAGGAVVHVSQGRGPGSAVVT